MKSLNFEFLRPKWKELALLGGFAEQYVGPDPASAAVKLRAFAIMGQVLVFRVAQTLVLRRMEWRTISEAERTRIKRVIISHIDAILDAEADAQ